MQKNYSVFFWVSVLFAVVPGLLIIGIGAGVPPGESTILYGSIILGVSCLCLLLVWVNRVKLNNILLQKSNRIIVLLATVFFVFLMVYLILYSYCVVSFPDRTSTFFPLWLKGELADNIQSTGGREAFLGRYGAAQVKILINEFASGQMVVTRIAFIFLYAFIFLPFIIAFSLLAARINLPVISTDKKIFFSYAWGEEREKIIDELYNSLLTDKTYTLIRDKINLQYKGLISEFIQTIGRGNFVILAISDKYLRSEYCMNELYELFRNSKLETKELLKKIYPLRIEDINLNDPKVLEDYFTHWQNLEVKWKDLVNNHGADQQELRRVESIRFALRDLLPFLDNINSLTTRQLSKGDFAEIKRSIKARFNELQE